MISHNLKLRTEIARERLTNRMSSPVTHAAETRSVDEVHHAPIGLLESLQDPVRMLQKAENNSQIQRILHVVETKARAKSYYREMRKVSGRNLSFCSDAKKLEMMTIVNTRVDRAGASARVEVQAKAYIEMELRRRQGAAAVESIFGE